MLYVLWIFYTSIGFAFYCNYVYWKAEVFSLIKSNLPFLYCISIFFLRNHYFKICKGHLHVFLYKLFLYLLHLVCDPFQIKFCSKFYLKWCEVKSVIFHIYMSFSSTIHLKDIISTFICLKYIYLFDK